MNPSLLAALAALMAILSGCQEADLAPRPARPSPAQGQRPTPTPSEPGRLQVTVKHVVDGDTLLVTGVPSSGDAFVRLIGIDAPETGDGRTTRECFGPEARQWLRERAPGGTRLTLVLDVGERDRFGRVLAYAYRADGAFLNADLVTNGYARTMIIRPNVRHAKELAELQRQARSLKRGLWGACGEQMR